MCISEHVETAKQLVDVALIYFEDGAPHTAMDRLTKAQAALEKALTEEKG